MSICRLTEDQTQKAIRPKGVENNVPVWSWFLTLVFMLCCRDTTRLYREWCLHQASCRVTLTFDLWPSSFHAVVIQRDFIAICACHVRLKLVGYCSWHRDTNIKFFGSWVEMSRQKEFLWPISAPCDLDLDLWSPDRQSWPFHALARGLLVSVCSKIGSFFFSLVDERTDGQNDERTSRKHYVSCQYRLAEAQ